MKMFETKEGQELKDMLLNALLGEIVFGLALTTILVGIATMF